MSETSTATLRVTEGETVALNLGTQLAVVEDGQCYLIDLSSTGEAISLTPAPVLFHKIDSEGEEVGEESTDESIPLRYYTPTLNSLNPEGQQVYLDDEQARAVANLLEFHNQQKKITVDNSEGGNNLVSASAFGKSNIKMENQNQIQPQYRAPRDPLAVDTSKKPPLRTYGKRGILDVDVDEKRQTHTKVYDKTSGENSCFGMRPKNIILDSKSDKNPHYILPISSVLSDLAPRRKRRFFVDSVKTIPPSEFKQQLQDTSDIVQTKIDSAPPTRKAMYYLAYGGVGKFFAYPGRKVPSVPLSKLFFNRLTMMTEHKPPIGTLEKELEPLDADLRTPGMKDSMDLSSSQSQKVHHHNFNNAVTIRNANSFDSLCKGMNKPPKFEYKRKKLKYSEPSPVEVKSTIQHEENSKLPSPKEVVIEGKVVSQDQNLVINGTNSESGEAENAVNEIVYTIHEDKTDPNNQSSEIFVVDESQETGGAPSNFEMLIAAAEHHNTLHTSDEPADAGESEEIQEIEIKEEDEEEVKPGVMYCTNENMEQLIILGANGERYRVTASNQGELTLWPEAECDAN